MDIAHYGRISLELEVLPNLANQGKLFAFKFDKFWLNIKSAGSALYANREILRLYKTKDPKRLCESSNCIGNVSIHPSAEVHSTAVVSSCSSHKLQDKAPIEMKRFPPYIDRLKTMFAFLYTRRPSKYIRRENDIRYANAARNEETFSFITHVIN